MRVHGCHTAWKVEHDPLGVYVSGHLFEPYDIANLLEFDELPDGIVLSHGHDRWAAHEGGLINLYDSSEILAPDAVRTFRWGHHAKMEGSTRERVLLFIHKYLRDRGHPPMGKEISEALGISKSGARYHIKRLYADGLLLYLWNTRRACWLSEAGERIAEALTAEHDEGER